MDSTEFRKAAVQLAEYIAKLKDSVADRSVFPDVQPGFLFKEIPEIPPMEPESWDDIMKDIDQLITPGMCHWSHPQFHAYFPSAATYPGILADMISGAIGANPTSWQACPAASELETITMDWIGRALNLPKEFIYSEPESQGGGVHTTSASESVLCALLAARKQALKYLKGDENVPESTFLPRLVAYCSTEAHSCVEKATKIAMVRLKILEGDENSCLSGKIVQDAIDEDFEKGLHPFLVVCTLGTTGSTACDNIEEIGPIVRKLPACWLHVDAAYGGASFICPELRQPMKGLEYADSFDINPNKWMLINAESSGLFVRDRKKLEESLVETSVYNETSEPVPVEYRHWGIPLGRKFRALKTWMTLKNYGLEGIQKVIRNHCALAKLFERYVRSDKRFEVANNVKMGLVCFGLKGDNSLTQKLLDELNNSRKIHFVPTMLKDKYVIRLSVNNEKATKNQIDNSWKIIRDKATSILAEKVEYPRERRESIFAFAEQFHRPSLHDFSTLFAIAAPTTDDSSDNLEDDEISSNL